MPKPTTCPKLLQELQKHLTYNPKTGEITYKNTRYGTKKAGEVAGRLDGHGYLRLDFCGKRLAAHRVAWALFHRSWPKDTIDHINRDKVDNRIENLRDVPQQENNQNKPKYKTKNYYKGVSFKDNLFYSRITGKGKSRSLGYSKCPTLLAMIYDKEVKLTKGAESVTNFPRVSLKANRPWGS